MLRPVRGERIRGELIASPQFNPGFTQAMDHNRFIDCHETRGPGAATIPCTIMLFASSYLDYTNCILAVLRFALAFHMTGHLGVGVVYQMVNPPSIMVVDPVMSEWTTKPSTSQVSRSLSEVEDGPNARSTFQAMR